MKRKVSEPEDFIQSEDPFDPEVVERYEDNVAQEASEASAAVGDMLRRRAAAYKAVFTPGKRDQGDIDIVLCDLMFFCKTWVPSFNKDHGANALTFMQIVEGRREVMQRIKDFTRLDHDMLLKKYTDALSR